MKTRLHASVLLTVALLTGTAAAVQAKCRDPLWIEGGGIATAIIVDGVVQNHSLSMSLDDADELDEVDPESIQAVTIECWSPSEHGVDSSRPGHEVSLIVVLTKPWAESTGLSDDELVEATLRKATPGLIALVTGEADVAEALGVR